MLEWINWWNVVGDKIDRNLFYNDKISSLGTFDIINVS